MQQAVNDLKEGIAEAYRKWKFKARFQQYFGKFEKKFVKPFTLSLSKREPVEA